MNSLRTYLDILSEADAASPYAGSPEQEAVWNTLSQADKDWLTQGGGKPNLLDPIILSRAPNGGKPVAQSAPAPAAPAPAAPAPAETPVANAVAASGQPDDATGVDAAVAAQAAQPAPVPPVQAQPAEPKNRDTMTFGQAFADARKNGEKVFTWKGKKYNTELAKPNTPAAPGQNFTNKPGQPPATAPNPAAGTRKGATQAIPAAPVQAQPATSPVPATADKNEPYWVNGTRYEYRGGASTRAGVTPGSWQVTAEPGDKLQWNATRKRSMAKYTGPDSQYGQQPAAPVMAQPVKESTTSYDEVERLVSLIHYK